MLCGIRLLQQSLPALRLIVVKSEAAKLQGPKGRRAEGPKGRRAEGPKGEGGSRKGVSRVSLSQHFPPKGPRKGNPNERKGRRFGSQPWGGNQRDTNHWGLASTIARSSPPKDSGEPMFRGSLRPRSTGFPKVMEADQAPEGDKGHSTMGCRASTLTRAFFGRRQQEEGRAL